MAADDSAAGNKMARDSAARDDRKARIDPRYDPAFQRGYRGEVRRSLQARPGRGEPASTPPPSKITHAPAPAIPKVDRSEPEPGDAIVDDDSSVDDSNIDDAHADVHLMPPPRMNPYVVALWVIGIALSVGGVVLQWWAQMSQVSGAFSVQNGVPLRVLLISLANTVTGPMITVGLATIVGLIFMLAVRRRNVPSSRPDLP